MSTKKEDKKVNKCIKIKGKCEAKQLVSFRVEPKVLQEVDERQAKDPIFKDLTRSVFIGYILRSWLGLINAKFEMRKQSNVPY